MLISGRVADEFCGTWFGRLVNGWQVRETLVPKMPRCNGKFGEKMARAEG